MDGLFGDLPEQRRPAAEQSAAQGPAGRARLRSPARDQEEFRVCALDDLIGEDHQARLIWAFAEKLDLSELEAGVKARENEAGAPQTDFHLLMGLWLFATTQGIGSARLLARLCETTAAFRWLCGGVSVNHRLLSEFRRDNGGLVERLLIEQVASMAQAGLVDLDTTAQDGVRVRASAGAASFRREETLEKKLAAAKALVERLSKEVDEDPGVGDRRAKANRERAAKDTQARVERALEEAEKAKALREERAKTHKAETEKKKEPRASTTDAEARVMKMPDGGFRPAYNVQFASDPASGVITGVDCVNVGSDRGLAEPMAHKLAEDYGARPKTHLVDGGFQSKDDIIAAAAAGTTFCCPPGKSKHGGDPCAPRKDDPPAVAAWRANMASEAMKETYKLRCRCELPHARLRNLGLDHLTVRGRQKVLTWMRWFALAMNVMARPRLERAAAAAAKA